MKKTICTSIETDLWQMAHNANISMSAALARGIRNTIDGVSISADMEKIRQHIAAKDRLISELNARINDLERGQK
jgi:cell division protein FtsL